jgi:hypothetical protein
MRQPAGLAQVARQAAEVGALRGVHGEVVQARREALPDLLVEVLAGDLCAAVAFGELDVVVARQRPAGQEMIRTALCRRASRYRW